VCHTLFSIFNHSNNKTHLAFFVLSLSLSLPCLAHVRHFIPIDLSTRARPAHTHTRPDSQEGRTSQSTPSRRTRPAEDQHLSVDQSVVVVIMSASTSLPRPSLQTLVSSCFTATKESVSNCFSRINEKRAEQIRFAQDPTKRKKAGDNQLDDFGTFEKHDSLGSLEEFNEFGGGADKITEWQAGWNVTNAIQVLVRQRQ